MTDPVAHPEELLAPYVEGGLDDADRAAVEAHLAGCASCREDVALAASARRVLGDLPEVELPPGTLQPVVREIDRAAAGQPPAPLPDDAGRQEEMSGAWSTSAPAPAGKLLRDRMRSFGGLAAAAAIVLLLILAVPPLLNISSNESPGSGVATAPERAGAADQRAPLPIPAVERQDLDYDAGRVASLAQEAARSPAGFAFAKDALGDATSGAALQQDEASAVIDCTQRWAAAADATVRPLRLIQARYEGKPAYIGVYLIEATGQAPEKVAVWVLSPKGCGLIRFTTQRV